MGWRDWVPDSAEDWAEDRAEDLGDFVEWGGDKAAGWADEVGADSAGDWLRDKSRSAANQLGAEVGELELGQTDDPKRLVYGSTAKIREQVAHLHDFKKAFESVGKGLKNLAEPDGLKGAAATAFRESVAKEPPRWFDAADAFGKAADAMGRFAETVEWAQGKAKEALDDYNKALKASQDAYDAHEKLRKTYNDALKAKSDHLPPRPSDDYPDPGKEMEKAAKEKLNSARKQRDEQADTVAAAVRAARDAAPAKPSYSEQLADGIDYLDLASTHLVGGLVKGSAGVVNFARGLNPFDLYNLSHPAEYRTNLSSTAAGLVVLVNDPVGAGKQMLDEFLKDPNEGVGKLIAEAIGSKGTGAAKRFATATKHLDDVKGPARNGLDADGPHHSERPDNTRTSGRTDPIDLATGRMYLPQVDVVLPGTLPLVFSRRAESGYTAGRWFGPTWSSTIDQHLEIDPEGIVLVTEDGLVVAYPHAAPGIAVLPVSASAPQRRLERLPEGDWTVTDPVTGHSRRFSLPAESTAGYEHGEMNGIAPIVELEDRHGNLITFEYDEQGTPQGISHNGGYRLRFDSADGRITALHLDGGPRILSYGYTDGNLTDVTNSSGLPLRFTYDEHARITSWTDSNGSTYAYTYDERHRCVAEAGEAGHIALTITYGEVDPQTGLRTTRLTTAAGQSHRYVIDKRCRVVAEIDPLGAQTRTTYDLAGRRLAQIGPLGTTTQNAYDDEGRLVSVTRPDGRAARAEYDVHGNAVKLVGWDGNVIRQTFDDRGNRTSITRADGTVTRYTYNDRGHLTTITAPLGSVTRIATDPAGLTVAVTDRLGATTACKRDGFGRPIEVTDAAGGVTRTEWSVEGKLLRRVGPDGGEQRWVYDGEGNCVSEEDGSDTASTRLEYTHFDLLAARTDADGARHEYTYDAALRLTGVRNPQGLLWEYEYDAAGRLVTETDFDGRSLRYEYDAASRLVARTDALGQRVTYERDTMGQVIRKDAQGLVTSYEYDIFDKVARAVSADSVLVRLRDRTGRLLRETVDGRTLTFDYDATGRRTGRTTPTGASTEVGFDAAGRRETLTTSGRPISFTHDALGREIDRTYGDVVSLASNRDAAGRLTGQLLTDRDGRVLQRRGYAYRADGHLTGMDDLLAGPRTFELDVLGRVTAVHAEDWTERYAYDVGGNQTSASWPASHPGGQDAGGPRIYDNGRLVRAGGMRYEYDGLGRVTLRQKTRLSRKPDTWLFNWNAEDQITEVTDPAGTRWRYTYDGLGRRSAKERLTADGREVAERTVFTWDGEVLCEQVTHSPADSRSTGVAITWDHQGFMPIAQTERVLSDAEVVDERFFAIVTDLIGAPRELVDEDGNIAWRTRSTLWGSTTWNRDASAYTPLRLPGQYYDPESGLHYNYFRTYDPETARYLSPDPLGLAPAANPVAYVQNPHRWADPLGLSPYDLEDLGDGWFRSREGLDYGPGRNGEHRITHVMDHGHPNLSKPDHGVFDTGSKGILETVDEAWVQRDLAVNVNVQGARTTYIIPMNRQVGYEFGQDYISLTVEHGNEVITAFPRSFP
ncbi:putative T7SS-secreted protein [Streptomyces virginiae]|uniref:putative T7SS-secreted protein n=1 Tax=Streptomyces virginiae TaxID=1961 RepID=UPI00365A655F